MSETLADLQREVSADPGSDKFPQLAKLLGEDVTRRAEAREICFRGLAAQPENHLGRLILARLFYLDGMFDFAARELAEIRSDASTPSVGRLLAEFGERAEKYARKSPPASPKSAPKEDEGVVAEISLDTEFIEAMNELEKE